MERLSTGDGPQPERFSVPAAFYWLIRSVKALGPVLAGLGTLESRLLAPKLAAIPIDRPIYICGLSRAGTTISAQMLSDHPDATTHRYSDFAMPYLPWCWNRLLPRLPTDALRKPMERIHRDRLLVTRDSAEDVEEMIWALFFGLTHGIADEGAVHPAFERFFANHIRKLLLVRGRSRYVTKSMLGVSRLEYLRRLFPDVRILLCVRHPVDHVASMLKQDRLWQQIQRHEPRLITMTEATAHHGFGRGYVPLNVTDEAVASEIRRCHDAGQTVRARALHWASVYSLTMEKLRSDPALARAVCVVRYEDLCRKAGETIDRVLAHTGLSSNAFAPVRKAYLSRLTLPDYYKPDFSARDLSDIAELTKEAAGPFGYDLP